MSLKEIFTRIFARRIAKKTDKWMSNGITLQRNTLQELLVQGKKTAFGKDHNFETITDYDSFKKSVPIRDYERMKAYFDRIVAGESDVLWPGKPIYLCKSSGTTSGAKFLPITKASLPNHINSARDALLNYIHESGHSNLINGKMIFIQGSPELEQKNGIQIGRLSGIVAHHVPNYLQKHRLPSFQTNCISDWEEKVDAIVTETMNEKMTLIGGIPPWMQMYFEKVLEKSGKQTIKEVFPELQLIVVGGVNFEPYKKRFLKLLGPDIDFLEMYPASEGFFAYQNKQSEKDLLLLLDENIFYEFIPAEKAMSSSPERICIKDVELNKNYAVVLNSNAGFWGYLLGDTVKFTSIKPYKIVVTGRIKHFLSAFGEHVIAEEVESAIEEIAQLENVDITEFTVAPQLSVAEGELPYHEWFIEFKEHPDDLVAFQHKLDALICEKNIYYNDLITGAVLQKLKITVIKPNGFKMYMEEMGKFGGQNKVVHLCNDRSIADKIKNFDLT
ncbi:MAG: GH3 auxin-responsive promoter family protein [Crocinitomicaceae bacterium]|nr:GH3 auxin-responsive promoter family protein [Crocinitomicaceae bacterium]